LHVLGVLFGLMTTRLNKRYYMYWSCYCSFLHQGWPWKFRCY